MNGPAERKLSRRALFRTGGRSTVILGLGAAAAALALRRPAAAQRLVWQIDPKKCIACGNCETHCVLKPSAVKCLHTHAMCGRCNFCFGYYDLRGSSKANSGVEYQLCPTHAIRREYLGGPYFEYLIDEDLCIGCGVCVKGCTGSGNGSLHLQVRHPMPADARGDTPDGTCVNCNECSIAVACPSDAFVRVPADDPYPFSRARAQGPG